LPRGSGGAFRGSAVNGSAEGAIVDVDVVVDGDGDVNGWFGSRSGRFVAVAVAVNVNDDVNVNVYGRQDSGARGRPALAHSPSFAMPYT
jgi:hypothetical protein